MPAFDKKIPAITKYYREEVIIEKAICPQCQGELIRKHEDMRFIMSDKLQGGIVHVCQSCAKRFPLEEYYPRTTTRTIEVMDFSPDDTTTWS